MFLYAEHNQEDGQDASVGDERGLCTLHPGKAYVFLCSISNRKVVNCACKFENDD